MKKVNIRVEKRDRRAFAPATGGFNGPIEGVEYYALETGPYSGLFRGCPLGRGSSVQEAILDFIRRAHADDRNLVLAFSDCVVVREDDYTEVAMAAS